MKTTISVTIDTDLYNWAKIRGIKRSELMENTLRNLKNGIKGDELEAKYKNLIAQAVADSKEVKEENAFLWKRIDDFQNKSVQK